MTNRLADSTSAYLRQHAEQPVEWWPWGDEALAEAARLERPLLVSIGYASCHWCHVMAQESFDDPAVAAAMNAAFVNVKVDREERPDVDALYMAALQAMTGRGGWPLNAFATPDGRPFYAGTYFPPHPRHGLPSWTEVVAAVSDAWRTRRADIDAHSRDVVEGLSTWRVDGIGPSVAPASSDLDGAAAALVAQFDRTNGGLGGAPKFPQVGVLRFLLQRGRRTADPALCAPVLETVDAMIAGGLHDQLAGGFHRYCVDATWTVPHFEKMLYDNAQLLALFADVGRLTPSPDVDAAARRTAAYVLDELGTPDGCFWSAQDADTSAGEGVFHTWTPAELAGALGPVDAAVAAAWFGVTARGHIDGGRSVLTARSNAATVAAQAGVDAADVPARLDAIRDRLMAVRRRREPPATDRKVVAGWNALTIDALPRAGAALDAPDLTAAAVRAADALAALLRLDTPAGPRLAHHWAGGRLGVPAFCDDVAAVVGAWLSLYEATLDGRWLDEAVAHAATLVADFAAADGGPFRPAGPHHPRLAAAVPDVVDGATPSGNAAACLALLRLAAATGEARWTDAAAPALGAVAAAAIAAPAAFGDTLAALDAYVDGVRTVTLSRPDATGLARAARRRYNGATVVRLAPAAAAGGLAASAVVCVAGRCLAPATTAEGLQAALDATDRG